MVRRPPEADSPSSVARDKPRFGEPLEAIKFLCKDFWTEAFKKHVDNLKTNYRARAAPATAARPLTPTRRACTC